MAKKRIPKQVKVMIPIVVSVTDTRNVYSYSAECENAHEKLSQSHREQWGRDLLSYENDRLASHVVWIEAAVPVPEIPKIQKVEGICS